MIANNTVFPTADPVAMATALYKLERLGTSSGDPNQTLVTRYFPLEPSDPAGPEDRTFVYSFASGGPVKQWIRADNNQLQYHDSTQERFEIDHDYGFIRFGLNSMATATLMDTLTVTSTEIEVDDASGFPQRGRLSIGGEIIQYNTRSSQTFYNLTRAIPSTAAIGTLVEFSQCGANPVLDEYIGAAYHTTPRIEYEPKDFVDHVTANNANVHPLANPESNGIIYIGRAPLILGNSAG